MKVSAELFLLDNLAMNYCIFALSAVLCGRPLRIGRALLCAGVGALYALLSLSALPILRSVPIKLGVFALAVLPLRVKGQNYFLFLLSLCISAFLVGGMTLFCCTFFGGSLRMNSFLTGTVPLRIALLCAAVATLLPRLLRKLLPARHIAQQTERIRIQCGAVTLCVHALLDSGNLVTEPLSGLPVIFLSPDTPRVQALFTGQRTRPIACVGVNGTKICEAMRPDAIFMADKYAINAYICINEAPLAGMQAIFPTALIPNEWRTSHETTQTFLARLVALVRQKARQGLLVHPQRRNPAAPADTGGGDILCIPARRRRARKKQTDRAQSAPGCIHRPQV